MTKVFEFQETILNIYNFEICANYNSYSVKSIVLVKQITHLELGLGSILPFITN